MFYDSEKNVSFDIKFYAQKPFMFLKKESYKAYCMYYYYMKSS